MNIEIKLVGDKKVSKKMYDIKGFFKSTELQTVLEDSKNRIVFLAGRLAPKGDSRLLSRVYGRLEKFGTDKVSMIVKSAAGYAKYVEFRTKPHMIAPRNRRVMFWVNYSTPKHRLNMKTVTGRNQEAGAVFTFMPKPVLHPGTQAQPFLRPAVQRVKPALVAAIQRIIREKLRA